MSKKIIAIGSGDWHTHPFKLFNPAQRLKWCLKANKHILSKCLELGVPLWFTGDMFDNPKAAPNKVMTRVTNQMLWYSNADGIFIGIPGNHDQSEANTLKNKSPHYLEAYREFRGIYILDGKKGNAYTTTYLPNGDKLSIAGVPYYTHKQHWLKAIQRVTKKVKGLSGKKVLLLHGNAPGAKTPLGYEPHSALPTNLDTFFEDWDLVLFGHIHKPGRLSDKCYMLGSPIQQERGDEGCSMGYWEIYEDLTMKLIPLNNLFPEFVKVKEDELKQYEAEAPKNGFNYITVIPTSRGSNPGDENEKGISYNTEITPRRLSKEYGRRVGETDKVKLKALAKILQEVW